jgi:hypothetical protein
VDDYCDWDRHRGATATLNTGPQTDLSGDGKEYELYFHNIGG